MSRKDNDQRKEEIIRLQSEIIREMTTTTAPRGD